MTRRLPRAGGRLTDAQRKLLAAIQSSNDRGETYGVRFGSRADITAQCLERRGFAYCDRSAKSNTSIYFLYRTTAAGRAYLETVKP